MEARHNPANDLDRHDDRLIASVSWYRLHPVFELRIGRAPDGVLR
jgi:hypothetical protein